MTKTEKVQNTVKRVNPAKKIINDIDKAMEASLAGLKAAQARQLEHARVAIATNTSSQSQVVAKITDSGEVAWKLQGMRKDGVKIKAEASGNANNSFKIVNSQNRQLEAMIAYLWAVRNGAHESVISALAPMAQSHDIVKANMPEMAFNDKKNVKRAAFEVIVSVSMRATVWAK